MSPTRQSLHRNHAAPRNDAASGSVTEEFDYIIVGAGTAGCVLANRLTEDGTFHVLLLEAGGSDRSIWIQMPIGYGRTFFDRRINWMYDTEPVEALGGRRSYWPRGKVIGGSGSINAMVYVRGQPRDFDDWKELGNPGWGWDDVLPYFKKSEDFDWHSAHHGRGGPQHVTDISPYVPTLSAIALSKPRRRLDFPPAATSTAASRKVSAITRSTPRAAGVHRRPMLFCILRASGVRSLCIPTPMRSASLFEGRRAVGVRLHMRIRGAICKAKARREVILSGGAINSPQLLMLSGVGDAQKLKNLGIESHGEHTGRRTEFAGPYCGFLFL